jgi:hypothetical protein
MTAPRPTEGHVLRQVLRDLQALLPHNWSLTARPEAAGKGRPDLVAVVRAPDGSEAALVLGARANLLPRDVADAVTELRSHARGARLTDASPVVVAPFLSETARERITALGGNYIDSTGNVSLTAERPALFIRQSGAARDPWPSDDTLRSLKGRGAGRALRALLDFAPPYGVRSLAAQANVPLASLSRTVDLLDREGLATRDRRGSIADLDWEGVIRRWAKDYDVTTSNRLNTFLEPRGLPALSTKLRRSPSGQAMTGALAAQRYAPVAPARLAAIYVDDVVGWAERLGLRPADAGANVWLLEPYDDVVFERTTTRDGTVSVSPTQLAVDLLTGPGRDPAEGEAILGWMTGNERAWRNR